MTRRGNLHDPENDLDIEPYCILRGVACQRKTALSTALFYPTLTPTRVGVIGCTANSRGSVSIGTLQGGKPRGDGCAGTCGRSSSTARISPAGIHSPTRQSQRSMLPPC